MIRIHGPWMNNSCIIIFFVINSSWWCPWMLISSPIHHDKPQLKSHFPMVNPPFPMVRGFAPLPVLDLGHVHQAIRCGTILQGHRHEGAEGRSACHHAAEPLLTSGSGKKNWKILKRPWHKLRWKHEALFASELPNQKVNIPQSSSKYVKVEELDGTRVAIWMCFFSRATVTGFLGK
jgi:hypothetical protein